MKNRLAEIFKDNHSGSIDEIEQMLSGSLEIKAPVKEPAAAPKVTHETNTAPAPGEASWLRTPPRKKQTTMVPCIVIDRHNRWHLKAKVDLAGMTTTNFTWGYYGSSYPVFIENNNGELKPFYLQETAGESSNRLYKGANPAGFRGTFKHKNKLLSKIQVGLMVALVMGLFFMMFIFLNWE